MPSKTATRGRGRLRGPSRATSRVTKSKRIVPSKNFGLRPGPRIQRRSYTEDDPQAFDVLSEDHENDEVMLDGCKIQQDGEVPNHGDNEQMPEAENDTVMAIDGISGEKKDENEQTPAVTTEGVVERLHDKDVTKMVVQVEMRAPAQAKQNPRYENEEMKRLYEENGQLREMLHAVLVRRQVTVEAPKTQFFNLSVTAIGTAVLAGCLVGMSFL